MSNAFHLGTRARTSLFDAADSLKRAASAGDSAGWQTAAADALRHASAAVESSLDDLAGSGGMLRSAGVEQPQLAPRLRAAEVSLGAVLVDVWEAGASSQGSMTGTIAARLETLSHELRALGGETFDLIHEASDVDGPAAID